MAGYCSGVSVETLWHHKYTCSSEGELGPLYTDFRFHAPVRGHVFTSHRESILEWIPTAPCFTVSLSPSGQGPNLQLKQHPFPDCTSPPLWLHSPHNGWCYNPRLSIFLVPKTPGSFTQQWLCSCFLIGKKVLSYPPWILSLQHLKFIKDVSASSFCAH